MVRQHRAQHGCQSKHANNGLPVAGLEPDVSHRKTSDSALLSVSVDPSACASPACRVGSQGGGMGPSDTATVQTGRGRGPGCYGHHWSFHLKGSARGPAQGPFWGPSQGASQGLFQGPSWGPSRDYLREHLRDHLRDHPISTTQHPAAQKPQWWPGDLNKRCGSSRVAAGAHLTMGNPRGPGQARGLSLCSPWCANSFYFI